MVHTILKHLPAFRLATRIIGSGKCFNMAASPEGPYFTSYAVTGWTVAGFTEATGAGDALATVLPW
jgi:hypothetical protein